MFADVAGLITAFGVREITLRTHVAESGAVSVNRDSLTGRTLTIEGFVHAYGATATASVDWGDGSAPEVQAPPVIAFEHTYGDDGVYTVIIKWDDGATTPTEYTLTIHQDQTDRCRRTLTQRTVYAPRAQHCLDRAEGKIQTVLFGAGYALPFADTAYPSATTVQLEAVNQTLKSATLALARCCLWDDGLKKDDPIKIECAKWAKWLEDIKCGKCGASLAGLAPVSPPGVVRYCVGEKVFTPALLHAFRDQDIPIHRPGHAVNYDFVDDLLP